MGKKMICPNCNEIIPDESTACSKCGMPFVKYGNYENTIKKLSEASLVNKGVADYESGRVVDGKKAINKLKDKYDL